jgi:hypothetical protein
LSPSGPGRRICFERERRSRATTRGAVDLAKELGMEVTMNEKFAKGTEDFNILFQKAKGSGADGSIRPPTRATR